MNATKMNPGVYDPGNTVCPVATYRHGVLHLEKNCPTATNAAAGAEITGVAGQTFQSAQFTLKSTAQCQGGSPRFYVVTSTGLYFLGCNNVTPIVGENGRATYVFTAETLAASGWKTFTNPTFKNQGDCVSHMVHARNEARNDDHGQHKGKK